MRYKINNIVILLSSIVVIAISYYLITRKNNIKSQDNVIIQDIQCSGLNSYECFDNKNCYPETCSRYCNIPKSNEHIGKCVDLIKKGNRCDTNIANPASSCLSGICNNGRCQ